MKHVLYQQGDLDSPACIRDRNGDVVLGMCRICGKAEAQLDEPCQPAVLALATPRLTEEPGAIMQRLRNALEELHAMVWGECPSLLNEDSGGCARLDIEIKTLLEQPPFDRLGAAVGTGEAMNALVRESENLGLYDAPPEPREDTK